MKTTVLLISTMQFVHLQCDGLHTYRWCCSMCTDELIYLCTHSHVGGLETGLVGGCGNWVEV
jgi:hypothetical protein